MAKFNYGRMATIATRLLGDFTQGPFTLIQMLPGAGPKHNPGASVENSFQLPGAVASGAYSVKGGFQQYAPGSLVIAGDLKVVSQVLVGVNPSLNDKIQIGSLVYSIMKFDKVPPSGVTIVWNFYIRRG